MRCGDQEGSGDGHCCLIDASEGGVQNISSGESGNATRPVTSPACITAEDGLEWTSTRPPPRMPPEERAGVVTESQPCVQLEGTEGRSGVLETDRGTGAE